MKFYVEVMDPSGRVTRGDKAYNARKGALVGMAKDFKGQGWVIAVSEAAFGHGFDYELMTGIGQAQLTHTGWFLRIRDF